MKLIRGVKKPLANDRPAICCDTCDKILMSVAPEIPGKAMITALQSAMLEHVKKAHGGKERGLLFSFGVVRSDGLEHATSGDTV